MREKLPFKDVFLENCEVVSLNNFNSEKWVNLAVRFLNIIVPKDLTSFIHELESFEFEFATLQTEFRKANNTIVYWGSVQGYPNMKKLALAILTLPYSTSSIERSFSMLKDIKEPRRNRLCPKSIEACLLAHQELGDLKNFIVTEAMMKNYELQWHGEEVFSDLNSQNVSLKEEIKITISKELDLSQQEDQAEFQKFESTEKTIQKNKRPFSFYDSDSEIKEELKIVKTNLEEYLEKEDPIFCYFSQSNSH